jgi:uncharacterized protein
MHCDALGGRDSDSYLIPLQGKNCNGNLIANFQGFPDPSGKDEHGTTSDLFLLARDFRPERRGKPLFVHRCGSHVGNVAFSGSNPVDCQCKYPRILRELSMREPLPHFTYHPDPLSTGAIEAQEILCACCGKIRTHVYVGPMYGPGDLDPKLCPWCIADGSAFSKLHLSFASNGPLYKAGVPEVVGKEIKERTPAFVSWQDVEWLAHCKDACEFHGDASVDDVLGASDTTKQAWREHYRVTEGEWKLATEGYLPKGDRAFYKFRCRHCSAVLLGWDCA